MPAACKKYQVHPGSVNTFDSQVYDTLLVYHDAIESAKADYTSGAFPAASKSVLNKFIDTYNILQGAWVTYHQTASPNPDSSSVQAALTQAASAFNDLIKVYPKAANPPKAATPMVSGTTSGGVK